MATKAWRGEEVRRSTTFEDLQTVVNCSTRVAILVGLSGGPVLASDLARALEFSLSLLSNHFRLLRETGIVDYESDGGRHLYHLTAAAVVSVVEAGVTLRLAADDGSTVSCLVAQNSPVMRVLQRAIAMSKRTNPPDPPMLKVEVARPGAELTRPG